MMYMYMFCCLQISSFMLNMSKVTYKSDWAGFQLRILMCLYYFCYMDGTCHYNQKNMHSLQYDHKQ